MSSGRLRGVPEAKLQVPGSESLKNLWLGDVKRGGARTLGLGRAENTHRCPGDTQEPVTVWEEELGQAWESDAGSPPWESGPSMALKLPSPH